MIPNLIKPATRFYERTRTYARPFHPIIRQSARLFISTSAKLKRFELLPGETYTYYRYVIGTYEPGTTAVVKILLRRGMIAVDVGAHVGYYSRLFAKLVGDAGKVYSFEPNPRTFAVLQRNTRMFSNVSLFNMAVLDRDTAIALYESSGRSSHDSIWESNADSSTGSVLVSARPLDNVLAGVSPHLIKVDVEGSELEVLHGMTRLLSWSQGLILIVEWSPSCQIGRGLPPNRLIETIQSFGFKISAIDEATGRVEPMDKPRNSEHQLDYVNLICTRP